MYETPPDPRNLSVTEVFLDRESLVLNLWTSTDFDQRTAELKAGVVPQKANSAVFWESSDTDVATVTDGIVTSVATGTASITVTTIDGGFTASCIVEVINQPREMIQSIFINDFTLHIGSISQKNIIPVFNPFFVTDGRVRWESDTPAVVTVSNRGVVTAIMPGTALISVISLVNPAVRDTCKVTVIPLQWQFPDITAFLEAGALYYKPGFDFGTTPEARTTPPVKAADSATNTSTWTGTSSKDPNFTPNYSYDYTRFGKAGAGNIVPEFVHPKNGSNFIPSQTLQPGPYRSHTQYDNAALAHYAFSGFRQAHPWSITASGSTTRSGQTWSTAINVYAANTNTVQYSGLGVDLGTDKYIDLVMIYAGGNLNAGGSTSRTTGAFNNESDINTSCPSITLEYMPFSIDGLETFNKLYKPNFYGQTDNWNNPDTENNWPAPGYAGSPWKHGGKIVPNGLSWVYVFYFEQPVLARFLRCSFEQAPVSPPATGYLGRAFVNSFEVYNTRVD